MKYFIVCTLIFISSSPLLSQLDIDWKRQFAMNKDGVVTDLIVTSDGGSIVLNHLSCGTPIDFNVYIVHLSSQGDILWEILMEVREMIIHNQ